MGEGESTEWPDDNTDPFGDVVSAPTPSLEKNSDDSVKSEEGAIVESEEELELPFETTEETGEWNLPIRAAPLLQQFHDEKVTEYPLQQSDDGRKATSLVIDDDLLRIIDSSLDDDGQRRLKVSLSMKREITGFKHQHNELMHKHQLLWLGLFLSGIVFILLPPVIFSFIGVILVTLGVWYWSIMHLETHHLEFSNSGGSHVCTLHGYSSNRPFFRASMALLGSEMAGLLRNGVLETETLEQLHASLVAPAPAPVPLQTPQAQIEVQATAQPAAQVVVTPISIPAPPMQIPAPPQHSPVETPLISGPPVALAPLPVPLELPSVAPAPLLPPAPLPALGAAEVMPLPAPFGLPSAPLPLDAPLNTPEIPVFASPVVDVLSEKEQSDLLSELS